MTRPDRPPELGTVASQSEIARHYLTRGYCPGLDVIDLHAHYGPFQGIYMPNHTPEKMIATMDRCGVGLIVSSGHLALADMVRGNQEIAAVTQRYPGRWYAYLTINPNDTDAIPDELRRYESVPTFVGLKFHPTLHQYPLTGPNYRSALEYAATHRLLVLTHTWGQSRFDGPDALEEVAQRYPQVTFLAGHACYGEFERAMELARRYDNIYLELTAAYAVRGLVEAMVKETGPHKIVFGCDLPWFNPHYAIGCVVMAHIDEQARRAILHDNGVRLLEGRKRI